MTPYDLLPLWKRFSKTEAGKKLFFYVIRFVNPYTGRLGAQISVFEQGYAEVILQDRKRNRNHLDSVHAVALVNLGEFTSGIVVLGSLDDTTRGIVTHISAEFVKKARGTLTSVCRCDIPIIDKETELLVEANIFNSEKELVCKVDVTWKLGRTV